MKSDKPPKFEESKPLVALADEILRCDVKELAAGSKFHFRIMFTNVQSSRHYGGYCRKLPEAVRFQTQIDYIITIHKATFDEMEPQEKASLVVHEINHIMANEQGEPRVRRHSGDYCEIFEHDHFSSNIVERILPKLTTLKQFSTQQTLIEKQSDEMKRKQFESLPEAPEIELLRDDTPENPQ